MTEHKHSIKGDLIAYDVWAEGYAATGEASGAVRLNDGPIMATSFDEAVEQLLVLKPNLAEGSSPVRRVTPNMELNWETRRSNWEMWACRLFPTEAEAREGFG